MQKVLTGPEAFSDTNVISNSNLLAAIECSTQTIWHASVTNKMSMMNNSMAVVSFHTRVIGVQGLRVVDTSVFSFLSLSQPQSIMYALAKKILQHILNSEWETTSELTVIQTVQHKNFLNQTKQHDRQTAKNSSNFETVVHAWQNSELLYK